MLVDDADPEHTSKVRRKSSQSAFNQIVSCQTCFLPEEKTIVLLAIHTIVAIENYSHVISEYFSFMMIGVRSMMMT